MSEAIVVLVHAKKALCWMDFGHQRTTEYNQDLLNVVLVGRRVRRQHNNIRHICHYFCIFIMEQEDRKSIKSLNFLSGSASQQSPHAVNGALAAAAAAAAVQGCPGTPSPVGQPQSTEPLTAAAVFAATGLHPAAYTCE